MGYIFLLLSILFFPSEAFAWGPITHLYYGTQILNQVSLLIPSLQELLKLFPNDYLYGCIAADITLKKDIVDYLHNCHNWDVGLNILKKAKVPKQKAFAYGYLSHLAADTISHNYFVPYYMVASFPTKTLKHIYWELRFDATRPKKFWKLAKKLAMIYNKSSHDHLLKVLIKKTLFSFRTNKFIFNGIMRMEHSNAWYELVRRIGHRSSWELPLEDIYELESLAIEAIIDFLNHGKNSKFYFIDPSGKLALEKAKEWRKKLKTTYHKDFPHAKISKIKNNFKTALFQKAPVQQWIQAQ